MNHEGQDNVIKIVKKELEANSILNQPFKLTNRAENCDVTNIQI